MVYIMLHFTTNFTYIAKPNQTKPKAIMKFILGMGSMKNLKHFCDLVENVKNISEFLTMDFSDDGLYSQGMSGDHTSIYEFMLHKDWFELYEVNEEDVKRISVSTQFLAKVLNTRQKHQFMVFEYSGQATKLNITMKNKSTDLKKDEFPREFEVSLVDVDSQTLEIPETDYSVEFTIPSKILKQIDDELLLFDDVMRVFCDEENIRFGAKGESGNININLFSDKIEYVDEYAIEEDFELDQHYSNRQFSTFCKFMKLSENVMLSFNDDFPLKYEHVFDDDRIKVVFYLAPRVKEDETDDEA